MSDVSKIIRVLIRTRHFNDKRISRWTLFRAEFFSIIFPQMYCLFDTPKSYIFDQETKDLSSGEVRGFVDKGYLKYNILHNF